jgi:DnaJ-class molecular chaperone
MPNRVLCPKCHGQRTSSCSACRGKGKTSIAGITIGNCKECNGTGRRGCNVCGGTGEVEPGSWLLIDQDHSGAEHNQVNPEKHDNDSYSYDYREDFV